MSYITWLNSIKKQIDDYGTAQETDLVLLKNHLDMLADDIERNPEYKIQLAQCID
jgi:hypothetical protein